MKLSIVTATGKDLIVDFSEKTILVVSTSNVLSKPAHVRATPVTKGHEKIKKWPNSGTHYLSIDNTYIALDAQQAAIFNDASHEYWLTENKKEKEMLDERIPGLSTLKYALDAESEYREQFARMMEDEHNDGVNPPMHPKIDYAVLCQKYPRAALFVRAESYSLASNDRKATAGDKAKETLLAGGNNDDAEKLLDGWLDGVYVD